MPRKFIAFVVLLLPCVALAQERPAAPPADQAARPDTPGWIVDERTGCWVWNQVPNPNQTVKWSGGCGPDGPIVGSGTLEWFSEGRSIGTYVGAVRNGRAHGVGSEVSATGAFYTGEWVDGRESGHGVHQKSDGTRYEGMWDNGSPNGHGIVTSPSGSSYVGSWLNGEWDGHGTVSMANGDTYVGALRNSWPHGWGKLTFSATGRVVEGMWSDGCCCRGREGTVVVSWWGISPCRRPEPIERPLPSRP